MAVSKPEWDSTLRGALYVPYLTVRVPSRGKVSRLAGQTTGRVHQLLIPEAGERIVDQGSSGHQWKRVVVRMRSVWSVS